MVVLLKFKLQFKFQRCHCNFVSSVHLSANCRGAAGCGPWGRLRLQLILMGTTTGLTCGAQRWTGQVDEGVGRADDARADEGIGQAGVWAD
jgi:hypothetical protein